MAGNPARRVMRARARAESLHAAYEQAQADYYRAVAEVAGEIGVTELARRMNVNRQRVYQLLAKADQTREPPAAPPGGTVTGGGG